MISAPFTTAPPPRQSSWEPQIIVQLDHQIKYIIKHLGLLSNQTYENQIHFVVPEQNVQTTYAIANRPQLEWFKQKKEHLGLGEILHQKQSQPMASVFIQGGYGKPGLNFLKNSFEPYFMGGIQLSWNLANLYSSKNDREVLRLNRQKIDTDKLPCTTLLIPLMFILK